MLNEARVATRLTAQDLDRARRFYSENLGLEPAEEREGGLRYQCGHGVFALFLSQGASTGDFRQMGNYPSKGTRELGAWFRDSEGNMLGLGQPLP